MFLYFQGTWVMCICLPSRIPFWGGQPSLEQEGMWGKICGSWRPEQKGRFWTGGQIIYFKQLGSQGYSHSLTNDTPQPACVYACPGGRLCATNHKHLSIQNSNPGTLKSLVWTCNYIIYLFTSFGLSPPRNLPEWYFNEGNHYSIVLLYMNVFGKVLFYFSFWKLRRNMAAILLSHWKGPFEKSWTF